MTDADTTVLAELVADVRGRLRAMSKRPMPAKPAKRLLEVLDPAIRDHVLQVAEELRGEHQLHKDIAADKARQARAMEKQIVADAALLLDIARHIGGGR